MTLRTTPGGAGLDWATLEDAIFKWFSDATGIDVLWADQDVPQPPWPFGTLNIIAGPGKPGGDDNVRRSTDLNQVGAEVGLEHNGPRHFTVSCQVIQGPPDAHDPDMHARRLASAAQAALELNTTNAAFIAAGLAVIDIGDATSIDTEVGGEWTTRSMFDVTFACTSSIAEREGYIENMAATGTLDDQGQPITQDFDTDFSGT